jgi:hypothetical protein
MTSRDLDIAAGRLKVGTGEAKVWASELITSFVLGLSSLAKLSHTLRLSG